MQHLFARALETKMSRLDDARVHRADGHLMHFAALYSEKLAVGGRVTGAFAHRLQPGMAVRHQPVLFENLALEQVCLRAQRRKRRITPGHRLAPPDGERVARIKRQHGDQAGRSALRHAEPRAQPPATFQFTGGHPDKLRGRPLGNLRPRQTRTVGQQCKGVCCESAHGVGKSWATASVHAVRSTLGVEMPSQSEIPSRTSGGRMVPSVSA